MSDNRDIPFLKHILDAITDVENSIDGLSRKKFEENKDIRDATIRRIEIMGEAVKNISNKLKEIYPSIAWKKIAGARDRMIHVYFDIDMNVVWDIVKKDIPQLKKQIQKIKEELESKNKSL